MTDQNLLSPTYEPIGVHLLELRAKRTDEAYFIVVGSTVILMV